MDTAPVSLDHIPGTDRAAWRFITNHAAVLMSIAQEPTLRVRDIAARVTITERATLNILNDLIDAGYACRRRDGRHNVYEVHPEAPLRHPVWRGGPSVGWLLRLQSGDPAASRPAPTDAAPPRPAFPGAPPLSRPS